MNLSSARKTFTLITSRYYTCATVLHQPLNLHHFLQLSVTHHSLSLTQQAHAQVLTHGLQQNPFLATKLISAYALCGNPTKSKLVFHSVELKSMYLWNSKCGSLDIARRVFEDNPFLKDAISWSSMISGYGLHGRGDEAIVLYNKMLHLGITVVGILSDCGRSGLVNEGLSIYSSLSTDFGIKLTVEINAWLADLLGRSGDLGQALNFIKTMSVEPGPSVWRSLVTASVLHENRDMQDLAYRSLIQLESQNPLNYILLSNFYASSRRWDVVAEMRRMMKARGLKKAPGCSWISISKTHCFYFAEKAHPCSTSIYLMLDYLILVMEGACYSDDFEHPA